MIKLSIRAKLFLLVIAVLIPLIVLQLARINNEFNEKVQNELKANEDLAEAISTSFMNYVEEVWVQESIVGAHIASLHNISAKDIQQYVIEIQKKQHTILELAWINPEGIVIAASRTQMIGKSVVHREHYKKIIAGQEKVLSNLELSLVNNEPIVMITRAVSKDNQLTGMVVAVVDVNEFSNRLPRSAIRLGSRYGLVDSNGMIVYRSDDLSNPSTKRKLVDDSPAWKALKGETVRTLKRVSGTDNSVRVGVDYPIKQIGWDCFVTTSYDSVMAQYNSRLKKDIVILIIISLVSIFSAYLLGTRVLRPLSNMKQAVSAIKVGDFSARTNVKGCDELAATAEALDSMAESVEIYDKMKSQFFTNLSHELKTPLSVMLASVQLIESIGPLTHACPNHKKIEKQMRAIKQNSYRLIRMINNLIDVSKHDIGYLKLKIGNYNIVSLVENIAMSVVKFAETKGIDLIFDTDTEEKIISCDPDMIERIVLNLLSNAIKFTDKSGSILVNVYDKHDKVIITIKDTGVGIPENKLSSIFERFVQVDSTLNRNHEGSGIGLSIVKSLVEAHGGTIKAQSELGKGTEMIIELPAKLLQEAEINSEDKPRDINSQSFVEKINIEFSDIYELRDVE